ncbi:MAG TPA: ABC transporter permease [Burkholderiaceae bacterium]|jgi:phospholipid/cholesterol/gamma-HCH transport system permease protein
MMTPALAPLSSPEAAKRQRPGWVTALGLRLSSWWADSLVTFRFFGEVQLALLRLFRGKAQFRPADLFWQLDQAGPRSVAIVSLVSGLVGVILAYMGAVQLQRFGAQTYIADLVTIGAVREVAALMTGVILSGRVGAAYAAQLGSMQANEEIDALRALGIDPIDYLVLPRVLALLIVAPLLTAFAALVACAAGWLVAVAIFGATPLEYLYKSLQALTLPHVLIGLGKGTVYCVLVGLAGCRQGLCAGRSAQAVGNAVTASVVQAIVWIVIAASTLTVALQRLDW